MTQKLILFLLIYFLASNGYIAAKTAYEKELIARQKILEKQELKRKREAVKLEKARLKAEKQRTKELEKELQKLERKRAKLAKSIKQHSKKQESKSQEITSSQTGIQLQEQGEDDGTQIIRLDQEIKQDQKQKSRHKSEKDSEEISEIDKVRAELQANEQKALEFIFPSVEDPNQIELTRENFFSQSEKEQLLELWRATLARNRTIQFIIRSLSTNPDEIEQNNAVMQALSRALFVPFYAVSAIAENTLVSGGSLVGARVIGDVVDNTNDQRSRTRQITKTDLIVLFMLVDSVAERLRNTYYAYKDSKIEKELLLFELEPARLDAAEALEREEDSSVFFTRMAVRDLERRLRQANLDHMTNRRTLVELAGTHAVESVDLLIKLEVEEMLSDIVGV